jgi:hypothetical protein
VRLTLSAVILFGLSVALFQDLPAQGQTQASSTFEVVPTPNENLNSELFAASASSPNDIWAVGQSTIHFDGTTWTAFSAPMIKGDNNSFLQGVVDISPTLAWEHWNGTAWTATTVESNNQFLFGASADGANDAWAVGFNGSDSITTSAMHWDGTNWKRVATPNVGEGTNKLNAVLALAPNDVWAVGFSTPVAPPKQAATLTLIEHFDGTSWAVVPSPNVRSNSVNQSNRLLGLTENSANDIWAFGSYFSADGSGHQMTLLLHWDGTSWTVASSPSPTKGGFPCDLLWTGVVSSPGDVWILGSVHDGSLAIHMTTGADSTLVSSF